MHHLEISLVYVLPIALNCTHNCLIEFSFHLILSLPSSIVNPKVDRMFHFILWLWNCAFWPSIEKQTSNFLNFPYNLINVNPCIHASFSVWSLVLDFFNQVPNCPSNFNIYVIKPLIRPNYLFKIVIQPLNFNFFKLKPKMT
jgi:hypothetical protein